MRFAVARGREGRQIARDVSEWTPLSRSGVIPDVVLQALCLP